MCLSPWHNTDTIYITPVCESWFCEGSFLFQVKIAPCLYAANHLLYLLQSHLCCDTRASMYMYAVIYFSTCAPETHGLLVQNQNGDIMFNVLKPISSLSYLAVMLRIIFIFLTEQI
jgi:hypothetical protein